MEMDDETRFQGLRVPRHRFKTVALVIGRFSLYYQKQNKLAALPELHLDNFLILWGLRNRKYGESTKSIWKVVYQNVAMIYQIFMTLKWIGISVISWWTKDEHLLMVMGDFTAYLGGTREYYHFLITFATLYPTIFMAYCYYLRNDEKNWQWLRPFEMMKRTATVDELGLTEFMAYKIWQRVRYSMWNFQVIRIPVGIISVAVVAYCLYDEMTPDDFRKYGWVWIFLQIPWVWFTVTCLIGLVNVYACVCYYFVTRFKKLNADARSLVDFQREVDFEDRNQMIWSFLNEYDVVCQQLARYNYFWQLFLFLHFAIYLPIIFLGLFEKFIAFENISAFHMTIISMLTLLAFAGWTYVALAASSVAVHAHSVYVPLNKLAMMDMPVGLKTQLETFIRRLGGPTMGFNCYRMFTVTHENYYQIIMFMGSYFLLILDAPDVRKKYHV